jgi:hypothetical protein
MFRKIDLFLALLGASFETRINFEIHDQMFPHLLGEKDLGYPFNSDEQMDARTEQLDVQSLLDTIEVQIRNMPKSYGKCFRQILHRDLHERLRMYEQVARRAVQPKECDPRFVATRWEPQNTQ